LQGTLAAVKEYQMQLLVTDKDFVQALGQKRVNQITDVRKAEVLGDDRSGNASTTAVLDALPSVIINRFRQMISTDYQVRQIEIKVQISGTPFGVGVSGDATVTLGPAPGAGGSA
jgi:hypothetical protein